MSIDKRGRSVVEFLDRHRLPHTPANYDFGWRFLNADDTRFRDDVRSIADDGIRLTQPDVDRLMAASRSSDVTVDASLNAIADDIMAIIGEATTAAGTFSRDLTLAAADLVSSDGARVHSVVATMLTRAETAEARLAEMGRQTGAVVARLHALSRDVEPDAMRALRSQAESEAVLSAAWAEGRGMVIAIVCVNQSTAIASSYGIGVGERVLRTVGRTLQESCSPHLVGRWKARSLVVVFEGVSVASARALLDAARGDLAGRVLRLRENDEPIGVVTFGAALAALEDPRAEDVDRVLRLLADSAARLSDQVAVR